MHALREPIEVYIYSYFYVLANRFFKQLTVPFSKELPLVVNCFQFLILLTVEVS